MKTDQLTLEERINTEGLRPWQRLPFPKPCEFDAKPEYFYKNFVQYLIADAIKMMCVGLHIDDNAVEELRSTIDEVLSNVDAKLLRNPIIQRLQEKRAVVAQKVHFAKSTEAIRTSDYYLKDYDGSVIHRTWVVNTYLKSIGAEIDVKEKWTAKCLKSYNIFKTDKNLEKIIDKSIAKNSPILIDGMKALAEYKTELWNRPRYQKGRETVSLDPFNPGSAKQKQELFEMLEIEPFEVSDKTGDSSWGRKYIEMLLNQSDDKGGDYEEILQCVIDHSFGGIIRSNFLKAFDTYTIDGVLHGNIKLLGAKTARNTSNSPNLLNAPSSGSIYAKPLKKCFIPPKNMLIIQCDFKALEDVVLANLSGDTNKLNVFLSGLDGHSLNACGYAPDKASEIVGRPFDNSPEFIKDFMKLVDEKHPEACDLRQWSKDKTFKLAYGGFPDEHKGGAISQEIFDNYHNVLYPGVTDFRENYVLPTTKKQGYLPLGLGFRIYSDDPDNDIRTLNNSCSQFWSILTLIAINELNYRISEKGWEDKIQICSTIYDSIYAYIVPDPEIIQWYNNNVYEIGRKDFIVDQIVPNTLTCGLGRNWAEEVDIPVNASINDIDEILKTFKG